MCNEGILLFMSLCFAVSGFCVGHSVARSTQQQDAIEKGHAFYYKLNDVRTFAWYEKGDTMPEMQIEKEFE
jgi:hypothetical protein